MIIRFPIDPIFQRANRLFVLPFEDEAQRRSYRRYHLPTKEIKNYNVLIDGENFFDQPIRNKLIALDNIWKTSTVQGDDYKTGCVLDCDYFKNYYKVIAIDAVLDADAMVYLMHMQKEYSKLILLEI